VARGDIVLVPFPFTDLTGQKRRPALVISPDRFDREDVILCAITSRVPGRLPPWDLPLVAEDLVDGILPRPSIVKIGKLFTMHRRLVVGRFSTIRPAKLAEVLSLLRRLFQP
jgi:mRNA interferase MazF